MKSRISSIIKLFSLLICLASCTQQINSEILVDEISPVDAVGGKVNVACSASNGAALSFEASADWISGFKWDGTSLSFNVRVNTSQAKREATLTIRAEYCKPVQVLVTQYGAYNYITFLNTSEENTKVQTKVKVSNPDVSYFVGYDLSSRLNSLTDEEIVNQVLDYFREESESTGQYLTSIIREYTYSGEQIIDWDNIQPGHTYSVYAFCLDEYGSTDYIVYKKEFCFGTPVHNDFTMEYKIIKNTQTSIDLNVIPSDNSVNYFFGYLSKLEFDEVYGSFDILVHDRIDEIRHMIDQYQQYYGVDWTFDHFTNTGVSIKNIKNLIPNSDYYVFSVGFDANGIITTPIVTELIHVPDVVLTDDCSFVVEANDIRSTDFNVSVKPSKNGTLYFVGVSQSNILDYYTLDEIAAMYLNSENEMGTDWSKACRGERNLDTYDDLRLSPLKPDTEYLVLVFGVSSSGERTTKITSMKCRTTEVRPVDMKFDIDVTNITSSSANVVVTPSDNSQMYFWECYHYDEYTAAGTDENFIQYAISKAVSEGSFETRKGQTIDVLDNGFLRSNNKYIIFAFGYAGGVTTPLFKKEFTTPQRQYSNADVRVSWKISDGNILYLQDPSRYESYYKKACITFTIEPVTDSYSWYFSAFGNTASYLHGLDKEELIYAIEVQGRLNYNKTEVSYSVPWGKEMSAAYVALDENGIEASPKVISVQIPSESEFYETNN